MEKTMTHDKEIDQETYQVAFRNATGDKSKSRSQRPTFGRGRSKTPQQFNGIHRRRRKKMRW